MATEFANPQSSPLGMFQRRAQLHAEAGELWLSAKKDQDPWPVVICDEEMLQALAKGKRPTNARQNNGNWSKEFCISGDLVWQRCFPTMRLGIMRLCWTPCERLLPLDLQQAHFVKAITHNQELADAYAEAIEQYGQKNVGYWKKKLHARQLFVDKNSKNSNIQLEGTVSPKERESGRNGFIIPQGYLENMKVLADGEVSSDQDVEIHRAKRMKTRLEDQEYLEMDVANDPFIQSLAARSSMESLTPSCTKQKAAALQIEKPSTSLSSSSSSTMLSKPLTTKSNAKTIFTDSRYSNSSVDIYVGSPHRVFTVKDNRIVACSNHLKENLSGTADSKPYIMSPLLLSLNPDDFEGMAAYLRNEIVLDPLALDATIPESEELQPESEFLTDLKPCAMTYSIAKKLQFCDWASAVERKLNSMTVAPTVEFMHTVRYLLNNGAMNDTTVATKVETCLVEHFWELMKMDGAALSELMASSPELGAPVLEMLLRATRNQLEGKESSTLPYLNSG